MNTQRLYRVLELTPADQNIMLVGRHGIGKSQILSQYYRKQGLKVIPLFLGQMADPGDLIGLPVLSHLGGEKSSENTNSSSEAAIAKTQFAPPYWFPLDNEPIVLFLDELNRARPEILQTVMDLVLNRRLGGHQLPKGSRIISAVNEGDEYQLTMLDPALVSRFNVYHFSPTVDEWLQWAIANDLDPRVIHFIESQGTWLDGNEGQRAGIDTGLEKQPDRRAWHRVSDMLKSMPVLVEEDLDVITGLVGAPAASQFYASITGNRIVSGSELLNDFDRYSVEISKYALHKLAQLNESIFRHLNQEGIGGTDVDEQSARYASNFTSYYSLLEEKKEKEAIAHLCNLFESGSYDHTVLFIMTHCPELYAKMALFIANL